MLRKEATIAVLGAMMLGGASLFGGLLTIQAQAEGPLGTKTIPQESTEV